MQEGITPVAAAEERASQYERRNAQVNDELHSIAKFLACGERGVVGIGNPAKQGMVSKDLGKGCGNQRINRAVQNNWPLKDICAAYGYTLLKMEIMPDHVHK